MKQWTPEKVASASGAELLTASDRSGGPEVVTIDSRATGPGALFVGLPGANVDGGAFAAKALHTGAWGVLVTPEHAERLAGTAHDAVVLAAGDPAEGPPKPGHRLAP